MRTIPNSTGTATVAGGDAARHISLGMQNQPGTIQRADKTGSRSQTVGSAGRSSATWNLSASLVTAGTAGVVPDLDPLFKAVFGQAATIGSGSVNIGSSTNATPIVVTATSHGLATGASVTIAGHLVNTDANGQWIVEVVNANSFKLLGSVGNGIGAATGTVNKANAVYNFSDTLLSFALWSFRTPSTVMQRCAMGCVPTELSIEFGDDVATVSSSGEAIYILDSKGYATEGTVQKGGLTSFPTEPGSPVTNGGLIPGFKGLAVVNGNKMATIRSGTVRIGSGAELVKDTFGEDLPDAIIGDERTVQVGFSLYETDDDSVVELIDNANKGNPLDIILQMGTVAGSTVIVYLKNVILESPESDDSDTRYSLNVPDSRAYATGLTSLDEVAIHFI